MIDTDTSRWDHRPVSLCDVDRLDTIDLAEKWGRLSIDLDLTCKADTQSKKAVLAETGSCLVKCHRTVAAAACSQEKDLMEKMESHSDCAAAAKIGQVLANRLKEKEIPAIHFSYTKDQRYHGKLKALVDGIREHGVSFVG
ncbi:hypothetical protein GOP47_0020683 [Adiantum capillus-veneris]|uniref:50S ribosomal protein L18 n=1 Tax=Adiantum capillus-veneris TaxID=13818 RepID=A0A9D4Z6B4_ADICA|nr:hypothetical protein GOP47_0020683 [Adiantum capillus-veneris]